MADNYLEKKMEDRARTTPRISSPVRRKGIVSLPYPQRIVLAYTPAAEPSPALAHAVRAIAQFGCKVALICAQCDIAANRRAAEQTGARHIPFPIPQALDYVNNTWGQPDIFIIDGNLIPPQISAGIDSPDQRLIAIAEAPIHHPVAISNAIHPSHPHPDQAALLLTLPAATFTAITLTK